MILEIIIYLVVVSLMAMAAVISSAPLRHITFMTHAKADVKAAHYWVEGKFAQDNKYPSQIIPNSDEIRLTLSGSQQNTGVVKVSDSGKGWCLMIQSARISDSSKSRFWMSSADTNKIVQSSTSSTSWSPASGLDDLQCPSTVS